VKIFAHHKHTIAALLILLLTSTLFTLNTQAQTAANTGQIVGQILDPTDAAVVGATVTVRNTNTNFTRTTTTDTAGRYAVSQLPLGPYEVTTNSNGFKTTAANALVTLGSTITVNVKLAIGASSETVNVTASPITLEATNAGSRSVYSSLQLEAVPLRGQRVQNYAWNIPTGQIEPE
jgi:transcriptional regulator of nitric oxide reductase